MPFELRVALRYLTARRKQAFISVISAISMLGVVVGVMALMVALGPDDRPPARDPDPRSSAPPPTSASSAAGNEPFDDYRAVVTAARQGAARARHRPHRLRHGPHDVYAREARRWPGRRWILPAEEAHRHRPRRPGRDAGAAFPPSNAREGERRPRRPSCSAATWPARSGVGEGRRRHRHLAQRPSLPLRDGPPRQTKLRVAGTVHTGLYEFDSSWAYVPLTVGPAPLHRRRRQRLAGRGPRRRHLRGAARSRPRILGRPGRGLPHRRTGVMMKPEPLLRPLAGEGRHRHHHRPHRAGGRPQHRGHPDPARDGAAPSTSRAPRRHGRLPRRHHPHLHAAGDGHRRPGHHHGAASWAGASARVLDVLRAHPRARRRLPDLLRALQAPPPRRRHRRSWARSSSASWPPSTPRAAPPGWIPAEALRYECRVLSKENILARVRTWRRSRSKLQVTVPKALADQYGIGPGRRDRVGSLRACHSDRAPRGRYTTAGRGASGVGCSTWPPNASDSATRIRRRRPEEGPRDWTREDLYDRGSSR